MIPCAISMSFARSNMSANAPAASARKNKGSRDEETIRPTQVLEPVISNISQAPATFWMKVPEADRMFAAHNDRKWRWRRGATAEDIPAS